MGSLYSTVIANIFTEDVLERAIARLRSINDDGFLQHLNIQQPTIHFTVETEKDYNISFLDTSVIRDSNGLLTTSVYRKPTHTDQYLACDSHNPQAFKCIIGKCLYDRAKHLITRPHGSTQQLTHCEAS